MSLDLNSVSCFPYFLFADVRCMDLCLTKGYLVILSLWLCLLFCVYYVTVPNKGLCFVFVEQYRKLHMREGMRDTLQKFLTRIKTLAPNYPNWPRQQTSLFINQYPFLRGCFEFLYLLISENDTHTFSRSGTWKST